jgi:hypothetical protein
MSASEEWLKHAQAHREWAQTEIGKLFFTYENAHGKAWRLDTQAGYDGYEPSSKRLSEAWSQCYEARRALLKAIGGPA